jgi:hypothetical protein
MVSSRPIYPGSLGMEMGTFWIVMGCLLVLFVIGVYVIVTR